MSVIIQFHSVCFSIFITLGKMVNKVIDIHYIGCIGGQRSLASQNNHFKVEKSVPKAIYEY